MNAIREAVASNLIYVFEIFGILYVLYNFNLATLAMAVTFFFLGCVLDWAWGELHKWQS